jgi:TonB family protein
MLPTLASLGVVVGLAVTLSAQAPSMTSVPSEVAAQRAVTTVAAKYPPIAEAARVQGLVRLGFVISAGGLPEQILVIRGNPMLNQAAIDALRQWRFQAFTAPDGSPVAVASTMVFLFADDKTRARIAEVMPAYTRMEAECAAMIAALRATEAVRACDAALEAATGMAFGSVLEDRRAAGRARVLAGQLPEALRFYQAVLQELRKSSLFPSADRAQAFIDVARIESDMQDLPNAAKSYDEAAKEFRRVVKDRADSLKRLQPQMKDGDLALTRARDEAARALRATLEEYIVVLRRLGKTGDAAKVERQLAEVTAGKL